MARTRKPSMREIVDALAQEPRRVREGEAVSPGGFNEAGWLFDPAGARLERISRLEPSEARALVADGALLAFEDCGCGGYIGCQPEWVEPDVRARLATASGPRFVKGSGSPRWIDLWEGEGGRVVFAHGDVEWGDALV